MKKIIPTYKPIRAGESYSFTSFLRIPKEMILGEEWEHLSVLAILTYSLLLERAIESKDNSEFVDRDGYPYIVFQQTELAKALRASIPTVRKALVSLEKEGLIKRKHMFLTVPDRIYVRYFQSPCNEIDHSDDDC